MRIGGFQLSNKTSTQTYNSAWGLAKGGKGEWRQTGALGNTEGSHKLSILKKS